MNIAVLASTNGTDLQAMIDENIPISCVLVNKKDCGAAEKAKNAGIPLIFLDFLDINGEKLDRESYDRQLALILKAYEIDLIALVGWMRILSPWFVQQWPQKIINVHPSLLPKYPGMDLDVHQEVIENGESESGMTIHYVDEEVDHGEIICQKSVPLEAGETPESLKAKVQGLEKEWYPKVLRDFLDRA